MQRKLKIGDYDEILDGLGLKSFTRNDQISKTEISSRIEVSLRAFIKVH